LKHFKKKRTLKKRTFFKNFFDINFFAKKNLKQSYSKIISMVFNTLTILFLINSFLTMGLIFSQNESTKDATSNLGTNEMSNPLQNLTWFCVILEFIFFLIKSKNIDF
jgi:hypothetical protein